MCPPYGKDTDSIVSQEVRIVGPNGEKVDVMTFRGSFERDIKEFVENDTDLQLAVATEDDDAIETILQERFYHRPEMFYTPDKLSRFVRRTCANPSFRLQRARAKGRCLHEDDVVADTVDSIAARFNLRYGDQKWLSATAQLVADDTRCPSRLLAGRYTNLFERSQFRLLGASRRSADSSDAKRSSRHCDNRSLIQARRHSLDVAA